MSYNLLPYWELIKSGEMIKLSASLANMPNKKMQNTRDPFTSLNIGMVIV